MGNNKNDKNIREMIDITFIKQNRGKSVIKRGVCIKIGGVYIINDRNAYDRIAEKKGFDSGICIMFWRRCMVGKFSFEGVLDTYKDGVCLLFLMFVLFCEIYSL